MCVAPTYEKFKLGPKGLLSMDSVHRVSPETSGTVKKMCERMGLLFLQFTPILLKEESYVSRAFRGSERS